MGSDKHGQEISGGVVGGQGALSNKAGGNLEDVKPSVTSLRKGQLKHSSSLELINYKQHVTGIFEKFDSSLVQRQLSQPVGMDSDIDSKLQNSDGKISVKPLKLRVGPLKQQNNMRTSVRASNSFDESEVMYGKSSSEMF